MGQDLSSFDEYSTEVKSGRMEWSPVHKSERFWRENAQRLIEKNYELLKMLIHLLETSPDPLILAVASYDIGEFVRHYPRKKRNRTTWWQTSGHAITGSRGSQCALRSPASRTETDGA